MRTTRKTTVLFSALALGGVAAILTACGGGGGSDSAAAPTAPTAPTAQSQNGVVNVSLTDGPSDNFNHVWVTVKAISFHTDANQTWDPKTATWTTTTLSSPVTIDMTQLNNGALQKVFQGMSLPAGTYRQIRLFLAGADDPLTSSASAASLQWNDQVQYTDSTGATLNAPLEIAYPTQGIQLLGTFNVTAGSTLDLAVDFDLEHDVVPFKHDSLTHFTMKPNLRYFDLNQTGAIVGQVDKSMLCPAGSAPASSCAYNLIVKAELVNADKTRHYDARATTVDPTTGNFTLYPLLTKDASGNPLKYDILIRGRNMETNLIQGVTVASGATPTSKATSLQTSGTIPITLNSNEYKAQFGSPLQPLTSGWASFNQTLPGSGQVPYEVRWGNTDPFTGVLFSPILLVPGPLHVAPYNNGGALAFANVIPAEGTAGAYSVATNLIAYYSRSPYTVIQSPATAGAVVTFTPPVPTINANVASGSASVSISVSNAGNYDRATLVFSRFASIITTMDVSSALTSGTGSFTVTSLPAGSATTAQPGAYYYAYLRVWKAGAKKKAVVVPLPGFVDLRTTNTGSISLPLTTLN